MSYEMSAWVGGRGVVNFNYGNRGEHAFTCENINLRSFPGGGFGFQYIF